MNKWKEILWKQENIFDRSAQGFKYPCVFLGVRKLTSSSIGEKEINMGIKIIVDSGSDMSGKESKYLKVVPLTIGTIGGTIGTHAGPDAFGVAFFAL